MGFHALSDSENASSLLKVGEVYPDSSGGSDQITYTYNRQQQVLVVTDQGGTEHTYAYDALGRVTQDRVTALGSGVDGTVRRIGRTYDVRGLVESVSSYDNPAVGSGTVLNAVQFAYNGFGQLITEYQSTGGSVNTATTPRVEYGYASGADNTIRPTLLTYPNGRELTVDYGTAGGMDDQLSRVSSLVDDDDTTLAAYSYLGLGSVVQQSSPEADLLYTLADLSGVDDPTTGDIYSGLSGGGDRANWRPRTFGLKR